MSLSEDLERKRQRRHAEKKAVRKAESRPWLSAQEREAAIKRWTRRSIKRNRVSFAIVRTFAPFSGNLAHFCGAK